MNFCDSSPVTVCLVRCVRCGGGGAAHCGDGGIFKFNREETPAMLA